MVTYERPDFPAYRQKLAGGRATLPRFFGPRLSPSLFRPFDKI
jgi:hypothetical protein